MTWSPAASHMANSCGHPALEPVDLGHGEVVERALAPVAAHLAARRLGAVVDQPLGLDLGLPARPDDAALEPASARPRAALSCRRRCPTRPPTPLPIPPVTRVPPGTGPVAARPARCRAERVAGVDAGAAGRQHGADRQARGGSRRGRGRTGPRHRRGSCRRRSRRRRSRRSRRCSRRPAPPRPRIRAATGHEPGGSGGEHRRGQSGADAVGDRHALFSLCPLRAEP